MSALHGLRQAGLYGRTVARVAQRGFRERGGDPVLATEGIVFVVGSPRSGTTFLAGAIGSQPGFVDLGEVRPVKSSIRRWALLPESEAAPELRSTLERVRRLGFVRWKRLHRLIYVAAVLGVVHFVWRVKSDLRQPLIFAGVLKPIQVTQCQCPDMMSNRIQWI